MTVDHRFAEVITSEQQLRAVMGSPLPHALNKEMSQIDGHCRAFIGRSPFVLVSSCDAAGNMDISQHGRRWRACLRMPVAWSITPSCRFQLRRCRLGSMRATVQGFIEIRTNGWAVRAKDGRADALRSCLGERQLPARPRAAQGRPLLERQPRYPLLSSSHPALL
jgi:hypothetical protein